MLEAPVRPVEEVRLRKGGGGEAGLAARGKQTGGRAARPLGGFVPRVPAAGHIGTIEARLAVENASKRRPRPPAWAGAGSPGCDCDEPVEGFWDARQSQGRLCRPWPMASVRSPDASLATRAPACHGPRDDAHRQPGPPDAGQPALFQRHHVHGLGRAAGVRVLPCCQAAGQREGASFCERARPKPCIDGGEYAARGGIRVGGRAAFCHGAQRSAIAFARRLRTPRRSTRSTTAAGMQWLAF